MGTPLKDREGFLAEKSHDLVAALRELRTEHGLAGCVLISFEAERVGVNSSGATDEFGAIMHKLGDAILTAIDDGKFDPEKLMAN